MSKPVQEKTIRALLTQCLEKGPDFIRAHVVICILALADVDKQSATSLLKTAAAVADWRVKYAICSNIEKIGESFGRAIFPAFLTKNYSDFLLDQNPETKISALDFMPTVLKYIDADSASLHLLPCLTHVANDPEVTVT